MTLSLEQRIAAAMDTELATIPGVTVDRDRADDVPADECPVLIPLTGGHAVIPRDTGATNYTTSAPIEGWVTADADAELGAAIHALHASVVAKLYGNTLGGLAEDFREVGMDDPIIIREDQESPVAAFLMRFEVDFSTAEGNPYAKG